MKHYDTADSIWSKCVDINSKIPFNDNKNLSLVYCNANGNQAWRVQEATPSRWTSLTEGHPTILEAVKAFRDFLTKKISKHISELESQHSDIESEIKDYQRLLNELTQHDTDPSPSYGRSCCEEQE